MQFTLVLLLDASLADVIRATIISGHLILLELRNFTLINTADVTDQVRNLLVVWIFTEQARLNFHAGKTIALRRKARHLIIRQAIAYWQALKFTVIGQQPLKALAISGLNVNYLCKLINRRLQIDHLA